MPWGRGRGHLLHLASTIGSLRRHPCPIILQVMGAKNHLKGPSSSLAGPVSPVIWHTVPPVPGQGLVEGSLSGVVCPSGVAWVGKDMGIGVYLPPGVTLGQWPVPPTPCLEWGLLLGPASQKLSLGHPPRTTPHNVCPKGKRCIIIY